MGVLKGGGQASRRAGRGGLFGQASRHWGVGWGKRRRQRSARLQRRQAGRAQCVLVRRLARPRSSVPRPQPGCYGGALPAGKGPCLVWVEAGEVPQLVLAAALGRPHRVPAGGQRAARQWLAHGGEPAGETAAAAGSTLKTTKRAPPAMPSAVCVSTLPKRWRPLPQLSCCHSRGLVCVVVGTVAGVGPVPAVCAAPVREQHGGAQHGGEPAGALVVGLDLQQRGLVVVENVSSLSRAGQQPCHDQAGTLLTRPGCRGGGGGQGSGGALANQAGAGPRCCTHAARSPPRDGQLCPTAAALTMMWSRPPLRSHHGW